MWLRKNHTRTLRTSSRQAHSLRTTGRARRALRECVRFAVEPLEPRVMLTITAQNVLIIYNMDWTGDQDGDGVQDSLEVAEYYAKQRGVPDSNILGVHDAATADYKGFGDGTYDYFYTNMVVPVQNKLNALGKTTIDVLLFCYGVNDMVSGYSLDTSMAIPFFWTASNGSNIGNFYANPYMDPTPGFDANKPAFSHTNATNFNGQPMYLVSRLDGPRGLADALEEIDQATYAQKYLYPADGYYNGTIYLDTMNRTGKLSDYTDAALQTNTYVMTGDYSDYIPSDMNIAQTSHYLLNATSIMKMSLTGLTFQLPWKWEQSGQSIGTPGTMYTDGTSAETAPNALIFAGWYAWYNGAANTAFQWLPGSIANNLVSGSLIGIEGHAPSGQQDTPQLGRGLTAAVGTVGEPYTVGAPRPNVLVYYLLAGYSFAEAAMLSTPYLCFMDLTIGDPLYTPYAADKVPVKDTTVPAPPANFNPANGYWDASGNYHLGLVIDQSNGPEVASATLQYGLTPSYGSTASCEAFYERPDMALTGLVPGMTYYIELTLTNAVGTTGTYRYAFVAPPKTIYHDTFTFSGNFRYRGPTLASANDPLIADFFNTPTTDPPTPLPLDNPNNLQRRWESGGGGGTATGNGPLTPGVNLTGSTVFFMPVSTAVLQTAAGIYTFTAQIDVTGASDQWLAIGFGGPGKPGSSGLTLANAIATLGGSGGVASTYYGTGTAAATGHPTIGTVSGKGVDTISVILVTDGQGGATVSFSDTAGLLPPNSGGALTAAQLANIADVFIGSNGTAAGTITDVTLTYTTLPGASEPAADTTTTTVTSSMNGQAATFTATVTADHLGTGIPGGTVTFMDGNTPLGTVALDAFGVASFTTGLDVGDHTITAVYNGDTAHNGGTSDPMAQDVAEATFPYIVGV
ncbi:MAG: TIGR03790 family protein, partial [Phycisphaerales bacterium]|nr:TIGR03790 family protein [Phycisphaerales bacterium]